MKLKILIKRTEVWKEYESSANEQNSLNNPMRILIYTII